MTYTNQNETDLLDACMKADTIVFLAPSSYLGDFVTPLVDNLRQRSEKLRLIAADDYFHANRGKAPGFDEIRTVAAYLANPQGPNSITVNCSFQLPTWLYFDPCNVGCQGGRSTCRNSSISWTGRGSIRPDRSCARRRWSAQRISRHCVRAWRTRSAAPRWTRYCACA